MPDDITVTVQKTSDGRDVLMLSAVLSRVFSREALADLVKLAMEKVTDNIAEELTVRHATEIIARIDQQALAVAVLPHAAKMIADRLVKP